MSTTEPSMTHAERQAAIDDLLESPTMQHICGMVTSSPFDASQPGDLKDGLLTMALAMIQASDDQRIKFADDALRVMFNGLLGLVLEAVTDGQFAKELVRVGALS